MAPIRRYLQISKHYFLEVRLHLEDPYSQSWLLNPRNDVLTRIIDTIKPLVIRQLRDDRERARGKSKKRKGIKDVAYGGRSRPYTEYECPALTRCQTTLRSRYS